MMNIWKIVNNWYKPRPQKIKKPRTLFTQYAAVFYVGNKRVFIPKGTKGFWGTAITEDKGTWPSKP